MKNITTKEGNECGLMAGWPLIRSVKCMLQHGEALSCHWNCLTIQAVFSSGAPEGISQNLCLGRKLHLRYRAPKLPFLQCCQNVSWWYIAMQAAQSSPANVHDGFLLEMNRDSVRDLAEKTRELERTNKHCSLCTQVSRESSQRALYSQLITFRVHFLAISRPKASTYWWVSAFTALLVGFI